MAWYSIPKVKVRYLKDSDGKVTGIYLSIQDFEKLAEKMEDFLDNKSVEKVKKQNKKFYSLEEIEKLIESKKR